MLIKRQNSQTGLFKGLGSEHTQTHQYSNNKTFTSKEIFKRPVEISEHKVHLAKIKTITDGIRINNKLQRIKSFELNREKRKEENLKRQGNVRIENI